MQGSISAIIPTFNRSNFLQEAIDALLHQTRPVAQIVVWDDGSTDATPEIVKSAMNADKRGVIQYFRAENQGKSFALNSAMKEVRGEYVWICDDDDIACLDAAEKMAEVLDATDVGIVAGAHARFRTVEPENDKEFFGTGYWPDLSSGSIIRHLLEDIFFFQNASLVRHACFDEVGPFREDLSRSIDYEMFVRLCTRFRVKMIDDVLFYQRKHDGSRGPAGQQHAAKKSEEVWLSADREIFRDLYQTLPISFYASFFEAEKSALALRAAHLQRACVYARRCDWMRAIEDFKAAAQMAENDGLTPTEIDIVVRSMAGKHGNAEAYSSPVRKQLLSLSQFGLTGKTILNALGRGSVWRAREALNNRDFKLLTKITTFLLQSGARPHPGTSASHLSELDHLTHEAYNW
ncbi:glycosyltransferase family 2 protein [Shimia sp. R9_3]|uniref:glycosyltransferase family 2 protein n=1 Tax=Shimia sp. R9_3 TaxID=2821113 RepID=UPI001AD9D7BB|nr:glycosyltransferase family 2 protein [Shimia sp. R9_3]MBO9403192.1 glycosyltransferase family 2 protein [Shimia sp. R9_3]